MNHTGPLETSIVEEIEGDPQLRGCISEMMFEQHYDHQGKDTFGILMITRQFRSITELSLFTHFHILNYEQYWTVMSMMDSDLAIAFLNIRLSQPKTRA